MTFTKFYQDVIKGLSENPKYLQSKYFYDAKGDALFRQIMKMPEYYLTRCELEIIQTYQSDIISQLKEKVRNVLELGPGDGLKSIYLIKELLQQQPDLQYLPIDISSNDLLLLQKKLHQQLPKLHVHTLAGEYFEMLTKCSSFIKEPKLLLFLGSSIGNFPKSETLNFLKKLKQFCQNGDFIFIGFDLEKDADIILPAYDDEAGITKAFNLNLLERINNELAGDFVLENFKHEPIYEEETGACKSFLTSIKKQKVRVGEKVFNFEENEQIYMEISQKFTVSEIEEFGLRAGLEKVAIYFDEKKWFANVLWKVNES